MIYCEVAVNYPKEPSVLTYKIPENLSLKIGEIIKVPLGRRDELGCVVGFINECEFKTREVLGKEQEFFELSDLELELYKWVAKYYMYPLGKLIFDCMPKYLKRVKDPDFVEGKAKSFELSYNENQIEIISKINSLKNFSQSLIHGVTGSGKSLIFLELIKEKIKEGKSVQYLLPEINLTPQFTNFFSDFLGCKIYSYNSSIKGSQKFNLWRTVKTLDEPALFIGVRSSIYLPIKNLGLIVIDEEHDKSFKQDDRCRYHARDVAIKKAQLGKFPIVMASATPTVESYERFTSKENLNYFTLKKRFNNTQLPELKIVDNADYKSDHWPLNIEVINRLEESMNSGYQAIVFVNKLGYSRYIQCRDCGHTFDCPNCDIKLTQFKSRKTLECYSCDYKDSVPTTCPECGCLDLFQGGYGTEKIEKTLMQIFPDKSISRFDRDEVKKIDDVEEKLKLFAEKEIDILVGTQMLSKGHNFKNVDTIVILGVDHMLHRPDFRAQEEVYQQVVQVSGRAGRFGEDALVYIQSDISPKVFEYVKSQSFDEFYKDELKIRESLNFPPFSRISKLEGISKNEDALYIYLSRLRDELRKDPEINIQGPIPEILRKRVNKYHYYLLLRGKRLKIQSKDRTIELRSHIDP